VSKILETIIKKIVVSAAVNIL